MTDGARRGRFLVLEGIDGSGKTTQAEHLVAALGGSRAGEPLHLREPGSTALGERLRAILLERGATIGPAAEALLFTAARRQMLEERVRPALAAGRDVVCERFHGSTFAYQGVAGGIEERALLALLETWAGAPRPDLCIVLDLEPETAAARLGVAPDRFEERGLDFQRRVAEGYRRYAEIAARVVLVQAEGAADEVAERVLAEVRGARR